MATDSSLQFSLATFGTAVNCIDGRVQQPVAEYLKKRFHVDCIDAVNEPGMNLLLATRSETAAIESVMRKIDISIRSHGSRSIAVVGHYDCAGNPTDAAAQAEHTREAVRFLQRKYPALEVIGLWVDDKWTVHEVPMDED